MNCLYITLFFNIVASIAQTFIKSWNQLLYPRVIEVCCQPFWIFWFWENVYGAIAVTVAWIQEWWKTRFICSHNGVQKLTSFLCMVHEKLQRKPIHFVLWSSVNILGTQHAHNFLYPNFSVTSSWIVVLDTSGMMWCDSLIVTRWFARISSISWRRSSEIEDGLPLLCSSWTSVLPSENSQHHFVTFCRSITLP